VTLSRALAALGDGIRAVMVGDRSFDVVAAHAQGLPAIGVTWGIGTAEEMSDAERLIDAPYELPAAAAVLLGG
jgi:phosphoglycolate phosphatase